MEWKNNDDYIEGTTKNYKQKNKLAMFDMDDTIITRKSKKKFAIDENDWKFLYDTTKLKLQEYDNTHSVIIISNQAGIDKGNVDPKEIMKKIDNICKELKIEVKAYLIKGKNKYRKPLPNIFYDIICNVDTNIKESFYCGDAIGRKNDFSDTDYKFAKNCKINFYSPEHVFLDKKDNLPEIKYPNLQKKVINPKFTPKDKEMVIMTGFQGSGKSTISRDIMNKYGYVIINQDTLKTESKCKKECENNLKQNKCVIIDATNPDDKTRKKWIDIAKQYNYNVRSICMTTSIELAKHNNSYRCYYENKSDLVPDIAYNIYKSKFNKPDKNEGFSEIIEIMCEYPNDPNYYMYLY